MNDDRHEVIHFGLTFAVSADEPGALRSTIDALEMAAARVVFDPAQRVLVAGGGLGGTSLILALRHGPANVITYEPNRPIAELARAEIRVDGERLEWHVAALTGTPDLRRRFLPGHWVSGHLAGDDENLDNADPALEVSALEINIALERHGCRQLLLDVEGGEAEILEVLDWSRLDAAVIETHEDGWLPSRIAAAAWEAGLRLRTCTQRNDEYYVVGVSRA